MPQTLDSSVICEIRDLVLSGINSSNINNCFNPVAALPDNFNLHDLEPFQSNRCRFRGRLSTASIDDYIRYCTEYAGVGVRCFIDGDKISARTIFNLGVIDKPGHADNTAVLELNKTAPFRSLLDIDGKKQSQKDLAEWLEDWRDHLMAFDADGAEMDVRKAIGAVRRITIEATSSSDHEDDDFKAKRSVMESVEARSKDVMPAVFQFTCVPYDGLSERQFMLRYSILTGSNVPVLVLRIVQLEKGQEDIAQEFRDLLSDKFTGVEVETFIGNFSS